MPSQHDASTASRLAVSRFDPLDGHEVLLTFNTSTVPLDAKVIVEAASRRFVALAGRCASTAWAPGSVTISLPPLGYAVCEAKR